MRFARVSRLVRAAKNALWLASCWMLKPTAANASESEAAAMMPSSQPDATMTPAKLASYQAAMMTALTCSRRCAARNVAGSSRSLTARVNAPANPSVTTGEGPVAILTSVTS